MYTGRVEFERKVDKEILDVGLRFNCMRNGIAIYTSNSDDYIVVKSPKMMVYCSMDNKEDFNYNEFVTLSELLDYDTLQIFFDDECQLWIN